MKSVKSSLKGVFDASPLVVTSEGTDTDRGNAFSIDTQKHNRLL